MSGYRQLRTWPLWIQGINTNRIPKTNDLDRIVGTNRATNKKIVQKVICTKHMENTRKWLHPMQMSSVNKIFY
jgi:hypothetical protein